MKKIILSLILGMLAIPCHSDGGPLDPKHQELDIQDFSAGLNTTVSPNKLPLNASPQMYNWLVDETNGRLVKPNGYIVAGSTPTLTKVNFLRAFYKSNGSKEYLVSDSSTLLTTTDFMSYTLLRNQLGGTKLLDGVQANDVFYFVNGSCPTFMYNGTSVTVLDGTNNKPFVPIAQNIEYSDGRVWVLNTTASASALQFSAITDTAGVIIQSYDNRAWPPNNILNINPGDGQNCTSMWKYKGLLHIGKTHSIFQIFGNDQTDYKFIPADTKNGPVSDDSVVLGDEIVYFTGADGFYRFNGSPAERISDNIIPDIDLIANNYTNVLSNVWETQADFQNNSIMGLSSATDSGFLTVSTVTRQVYFSGPAVPTGTIFTFGQFVNTSTAWMDMYFASTTLDAFSNFHISTTDNFNGGGITGISLSIQTSTGIPLSSPAKMIIYVRNKNTGAQAASSPINYTASTRIFVLSDALGSVIFSGAEVNGGSVSIKIEKNAVAEAGGQIYLTSEPFNADINFSPIFGSSAGYISNVSTITNAITNWANFTSINDTLGGNILFYYRTSTSVVNIATQAWNQINAGNIINAPVGNNRIQWATTMTVSANNIPPIIDNVIIQHNEGGVTDTRPIGTFWSRRPWFCVSTTTAGNTGIIYQKTRKAFSPTANVLLSPSYFQPLVGINIKSILNDNDTILYGGASTTGVIYRLDYGNTFNGNVIQSFYRSPTFDMGKSYFDKYVYFITAQAQRQIGGTLTFGLSADGAGTFSEKTLSNNGSGNNIFVIFNQPQKTSAKQFSYYIKNTDYGIPCEVSGLTVFYVMTEKYQ